MTFYRKIRKGDKVVASSGERIFGVGSVIGKYAYDKKLSSQHSVPVAWEFTFWDPLNVWDLPLSKELKNRLGLNRTILKLKKNEWDEIYEIVSRTKNPFRNLTNWEGLLRAPWTEQEVVILFSKLSSVLRMKIEYVRTQFPDATIMVKKGDDWIAKEAEFEVYSSQFKEHGHLTDMKRKVIDCDFIICWEDDWTRRPKGIKVIELKNELWNLL